MIFLHNFECLTTYVAYLCRNSSKSDEKLPLALFFIAPPNVLELLFEDALLFESIRYLKGLKVGS